MKRIVAVLFAIGGGLWLLRRLGAQARLVLAQFRRQRLAKILRRENLADLDLGAAVERGALHPVDGFIQRCGLDQPEAGDEVVGEVKWPASRRALSAGIFDARASRARMQALACLHDAGLDHVL